MKILYIVTSLDNKSPIRIVKRLTDYFWERGDDVTVAYFDDIIRVGFQCRTMRISMSKPIEFDDYDIVHSNLFRPDFYVHRFRNKIKKAVTVSTLHNDVEMVLRYSYGISVSIIVSAMWQKALQSKDYVVCVNEYLMDKYGFEHCFFIPNGVELDCSYTDEDERTIKEFIELHSNKRVIVSFSNIVRVKGLHQLLEFVKQNQEYIYICIGDGEYKNKLIEKAKNDKTDDRVLFYHSINAPYRVLRFADLFAITSYSEGASVALLEAGKMGASVVCSDIPAFNRCFSQEEVSFFKLDDMDSLRNAMDEAFLNRRSKGLKIKNKIDGVFGLHNMQKKYEEMYEEILNKR